MNKKQIIILALIIVLVLFIGVISLSTMLNSNNENLEKELFGTVIKYEDGIVMIQSYDSSIYSCKAEKNDFTLGDNVAIKYTGIEENDYVIENCEVVSYNVIPDETNIDGIPLSWLDDGLFKDYYKMAFNKLKTMTTEEKIGQLLLGRYPVSNQISDMNQYNLGGYVFYERDFIGKNSNEVKKMISDLQNNSKIPILTAVDEEGGRVVRVSSNPNLISEPFKSPSELYNDGGLNKIREDTVEKSRFLNSLGLNLNLAPVVDVPLNSSDYIFDRSLKQNTNITSNYAKTVIEASKGIGVSYTLKHFPGYANNIDTHQSASQDNRSYDDILNNDIPPFRSGIESGAEAVLVSHNTVTNIDNINPASLSTSVHNILKNTLGFTGIIIADDISMSALDGIANTASRAIQAGNDILITTDYETSFNEIKTSILNGTLSESQIDKAAFKVLSWKYYKMLMQEYSK